jgi:hypothetical protein
MINKVRPRRGEIGIRRKQKKNAGKAKDIGGKKERVQLEKVLKREKCIPFFFTTMNSSMIMKSHAQKL